MNSSVWIHERKIINPCYTEDDAVVQSVTGRGGGGSRVKKPKLLDNKNTLFNKLSPFKKI
jgi:hypothetical protein